jgi:hypothetical protein
LFLSTQGLLQLPLQNLGGLGEIDRHTRISLLPFLGGISFLIVSQFVTIGTLLAVGLLIASINVIILSGVWRDVKFTIVSSLIMSLGYVFSIPSFGISVVISFAIVINLGFVVGLSPAQLATIRSFLKTKLR